SKNNTTMDDRNGTLLRIIGRLKPGITAAAAKPALEGLAANLEKAYPVEQKNQTFITAPVSRIAVSTNPAAASGVKSIAPLLLGMGMFALGPALKISRSAVITDLKEHAGEDVMRRRWKFLPRNLLVVVQIAFSLALITAAALFIRGAGKAASVDTGLRPGSSYL